jgi:tryptophan halogenase
MMDVKNIAIVGGGTAGWIAASMLARALTGTGRRITVIESPDIGTVGVGEATIPPITDLLRFLGINEADFIHHTKATFKLGIKFRDWRRIGESYWHPFGSFGSPINRRPFFHYWQKFGDLRFNDYSLCAALGDANRFLFPDAGKPGPLGGLRYALHFDAGLVARYLGAYAEKLGVVRLEKTVTHAGRSENGMIDALYLADGTNLTADLFIDCSGFRGLLIEQCLDTGYLDWSAMLPCDRAVALPTANPEARPPYTQATARPAGWHWRIPLQHRTGNGYVYAGAQISDDAALTDLVTTIGQEPLAEPRFLRFVTGRRRLFWQHNCVALGLASGFLEPLESTSIHLVISGVHCLLDHFPDRSYDPKLVASYNNEMIKEIEHIRDFIILHYCTTERRDSPLWDYCRSMPLPQSLQERIDLYKSSGRLRPKLGELFTDLSWFYIFAGMGIRPARHDPLADVLSETRLRGFLAEMASDNAAVLAMAPSHDSYFSNQHAAQ